MLDLVLTVAPTLDLVTLDQVKADLKLDGINDHDTRLTAHIATALNHLDGYAGVLGRALAQQTWTLYLDAFPCGRVIALPLPPLISVGSIVYLAAADGASTTLPTTDYDVLAGERAEIRLAYGKSWPSARCVHRAVAITFTCGFATVTAPKLAPAQAALKLIVRALFSGESDWQAMPAVRALLGPLRVPKV